MRRFFFLFLLLGLVPSYVMAQAAPPNPAESFGFEGIVTQLGTAPAKPTLIPEEALSQRMEEAESGTDGALQYSLGYMFHYGENVLSDYPQAQKWYEKSAENGYAPAMVALAQLYRLGVSGYPDPLRARKWLRRALEQEEPQAYYEMAEMFEYGEGTFANERKAVELYREAAARGILLARVKLGFFYLNGKGVEPNILEAIKQFTLLGQETDNSNVQRLIAEILAQTYVQLGLASQDPAKAFAWYQMAADLGYVHAYLMLADAYRFGQGVEKDEAKAIGLYEKAAAQQNVYAMEMLGYLYMNGTLQTPQDFEKARRWYVEAAENGAVEAAWNVGNIYFYGYGVTPDWEEAQKWFNRSKRLQGNR